MATQSQASTQADASSPATNPTAPTPDQAKPKEPTVGTNSVSRGPQPERLREPEKSERSWFDRLTGREKDQDKIELPDSVTQRYKRRGDNLVDKNTNVVVINISEGSINAKNALASTITSVVDIAEHNKWKSITVSGEDEFKAAIWLEARTRGLEVHGYNPSPEETKQLEEIMLAQGKKPEPVTAPAPGASSPSPAQNVGGVQKGGPQQAITTPTQAPKVQMPQMTQAIVPRVEGYSITAQALAAAMQRKGYPAREQEMAAGEQTKLENVPGRRKPVLVRDPEAGKKRRETREKTVAQTKTKTRERQAQQPQQTKAPQLDAGR